MPSVDWIGFAVASVAVVLAPGPGSMYVARAAGASGARAGRMAMLGLMLADACLITLSLLGVSALFHAHPSLFHAVRLGGAGYLVFLGLQSIFSKPEAASTASRAHGLPLRRAFTITLLNPKAVLFFMAFFPAFIRSAAGGLLAPYAGMTLLFMAISATYLSIVSRLAARVGTAFQENRALQSVVRRLCGGLFVGFGIKVAVASR